jgi:hypothetical protein
MIAISEPTTHRSERFGEAGWMHWETSGVHAYAWDRTASFPPFLSIDIYTCKPFSPTVAIEFTRRFFRMREVVFKEC